MNIDKGNGKKYAAWLSEIQMKAVSYHLNHVTIQNELFQYPASLNTCFVSVRCKTVLLQGQIFGSASNNFAF
jgi:hypothetical protein